MREERSNEGTGGSVIAIVFVVVVDVLLDVLFVLIFVPGFPVDFMPASCVVRREKRAD